MSFEALNYVFIILCYYDIFWSNNGLLCLNIETYQTLIKKKVPKVLEKD